MLNILEMRISYETDQAWRQLGNSAKKDFEKFPDAVQAEAAGVLTI